MKCINNLEIIAAARCGISIPAKLVTSDEDELKAQITSKVKPRVSIKEEKKLYSIKKHNNESTKVNTECYIKTSTDEYNEKYLKERLVQHYGQPKVLIKK